MDFNRCFISFNLFSISKQLVRILSFSACVYVSSLGKWVASPVIPQLLDVLAWLAWISSRLRCDSGLGFTLKKIKSHKDVAQFSSFHSFSFYSSILQSMLPSDQAPAFCLSRPLYTLPRFLSLTSVEAEPSVWVFPAVLLPLVEEELLVLAGEDGKSQVCAANTPRHMFVSTKLGHFTHVSHKGHK